MPEAYITVGSMVPFLSWSTPLYARDTKEINGENGN